MDVEAVPHESHVNPFKTERKAALQVIHCYKTMQSSNHNNEDVCRAVVVKRNSMHLPAVSN